MKLSILLRPLFLSWLVLVTLSSSHLAQPLFSNIFPAEEFAARRVKVLDQIGNGVAILQGTTERPGEQPFRQSNHFFYLCGVAEPRAVLVLDGKTRRSTLYLYGGAERRERMFGSAMVATRQPNSPELSPSLRAKNYPKRLATLCERGARCIPRFDRRCWVTLHRATLSG